MAKLVSREYTIVGATPVNLSAILGSGEWVCTFSCRAGDTNVGDIFLGDQSMTAGAGRGVYLNPGDAWSFDLQQRIFSDHVYVVGTPGDKLYLVYIE